MREAVGVPVLGGLVVREAVGGQTVGRVEGSGQGQVIGGHTEGDPMEGLSTGGLGNGG